MNTTFEASGVQTGWTAGGGVEGGIPNTHLTWKVEYLYVHLPGANFSFNGTPFGLAVSNVMSGTITDNIVRVGLNYQFH